MLPPIVLIAEPQQQHLFNKFTHNPPDAAYRQEYDNSYGELVLPPVCKIGVEIVERLRDRFIRYTCHTWLAC